MKKILIVFILMAHAATAQRHFGTALRDSLLNKLHTAADDTNKVKLLTSLSFVLAEIDPRAGVTYGQQGMKLAQQLKWERGVALVSNSLGVNYETLSDYPRALNYYNSALKINRAHNDRVQIAHNLTNLGIVHEAQGEYTEALNHYLEAIQINGLTGDRHSMANNYGNIGNIYLRQENYGKGLSYYTMALNLLNELQDSAGIADDMGVIGAIYLEQGNYSNALGYFGRVTKLQSSLGNKRGLAFNLLNIGEVYTKRKDYAAALPYCRQAIGLYREAGNKRGVGTGYKFMADCYLQAAKDNILPPGVTKSEALARAVSYTDSAITQFKAIGSPDQLQECYSTLAGICVSNNNYKAAYEAHTNYIRYRDSVWSLKQKIALANMESKDEVAFDQKNVEIADKQVKIAGLEHANRVKQTIVYLVSMCLLVLVIGLLSMAITKVRRRADTQVAHNTSRFNALVEYSADGKAILSPAGQTVYVSPSIKTVLGYSPDTLAATGLFSIVHPGDVALLNDSMQKVVNTPGMSVRNCEVRMKHIDGSWCWIDMTISNLLHIQAVNGIVFNFRNITGRKVAEEKLLAANRLYAFISAINKTIVHVGDEHELFREACRIAVETGRFAAAWIGTVNTGSGLITLQEHSGLADSELAALASFEFAAGGPTEQILDNGGYYVCNNIQESFVVERWKKHAEQRGYNSMIILPVHENGTIKAIFNIYAADTDFFDSQEIGLLEEATSDISFALGVMARERERLRMEQRLVHSEFRHKQAQQVAHIGNWELSFDTGVAIWSEEACRIYGFAPHEIVQSYDVWFAAIYPDDRAEALRIIEDARPTYGSTAFHHRIIRRDGEVRHVYSLAEYELKDGLPVGLYGVVMDITHMKEAEAALNQSNANMSMIMDLIPQVVCVTDPRGYFQFVNKSFAALYGTTPHEMMGRPMSDMIGRKNVAVHNRVYDDEIIATNQPRIIPEQRITDAAGRDHVFYTTKVPYLPPGEKQMAVLTIAADITEQMNRETELKRVLADIVQRNQDLEQFSYIVSHNLRAPVANIIGLSTLLNQTTIVDDEQQELVNQLEGATDKLDTVIRDLNHVLQVKMQVNEKREDVNFCELVSDIKQSLSQLVKEKDVTIQTNFHECGNMFTLKGYLYSIFYNLISNSIRYSRDVVKPVIEICAHETDGHMTLSFRDNGMGIDLSKRGDQLFGLYKRFHFHTEGKGMGLYMVKTQVETLGGKIRVESEVDKGTTFTLEFDLGSKPVYA